MQNVHDNIGDFGSGLLVATAWASSVEHQLGSVARDRRRPARRRVPGRSVGVRPSSKLSPGDLDEAVTVLVAGRQGISTDRGTAFDRVAAFRAGFKHGPSKCVTSS